jgi:hypothetical protein
VLCRCAAVCRGHLTAAGALGTGGDEDGASPSSSSGGGTDASPSGRGGASGGRRRALGGNGGSRAELASLIRRNGEDFATSVEQVVEKVRARHGERGCRWRWRWRCGGGGGARCAGSSAVQWVTLGAWQGAAARLLRP